MLSTHPSPGNLRRADNLLPRANGALYSRPAAIQVIAEPVNLAQAWDNRIVYNGNGRLKVWNGSAGFDLGQTPLRLSGVPFQALAGGGVREARFYLADGISPLSYLAWDANAAAFKRVNVINSVTDSAGVPYPIPVPMTLASWANRIWIADGSNRAQHCQNDDPANWDPLWVQEFNDDHGSRIVGLTRHGDVLAVGLENSIWQVAGTSQYDFQTAPLASLTGITGPNALASDGQGSLLWVSKHGLQSLAQSAPLSDDLRELFLTPQFGAQLAIDPKRRLLLAYIAARLFVMHLDNPGQFSEITDSGIAGCIALADYVGWYGQKGVFLLGSVHDQDMMLDGSHRAFVSQMESWDMRPNTDGGGRALLNRIRLLVSGFPGGEANYTASADGQEYFSQAISLSDDEPAPWGKVPYALSQADPFRPVLRELCPRLAGEAFIHKIRSNGFFELVEMKPDFRYGVPTA